ADLPCFERLPESISLQVPIDKRCAQSISTRALFCPVRRIDNPSLQARSPPPGRERHKQRRHHTTPVSILHDGLWLDVLVYILKRVLKSRTTRQAGSDFVF